jgi:hypothetical protein
VQYQGEPLEALVQRIVASGIVEGDFTVQLLDASGKFLPPVRTEDVLAVYVMKQAGFLP